MGPLACGATWDGATYRTGGRPHHHAPEGLSRGRSEGKNGGGGGGAEALDGGALVPRRLDLHRGVDVYSVFA